MTGESAAPRIDGARPGGVASEFSMSAAALVLALSVASVTVTARHGIADDRLEKRSLELSLPDPYLDPAWPDEFGEDLDGRYQDGRSDSVEDRPLDEELEMQQELRELQIDGEGAVPEPLGEPVAVPAPVAPLPDTHAPAVPNAITHPAPEMTDRPDVTQDDLERDPVEW